MTSRHVWARCSLALASIITAGCAGTAADVDLLEARLRDHQDRLNRTEKLLASTSHELNLARKEADLLRGQLADAGNQPVLPEHADVLLRAEKLAFHPMMTGSLDSDDRPGDETLNIVLIPQDRNGETVRLFGNLELEALDLSRPEGERTLARWSFTPGQTRELWHNGFLTSGFQLSLPLTDPPETGQLLLNATLVSADGRRLNATHSMAVDPGVRLAEATRSTALPTEPRPDKEPPAASEPPGMTFLPELQRDRSPVVPEPIDVPPRAQPLSESTPAGEPAPMPSIVPDRMEFRSMTGSEFEAALDGPATSFERPPLPPVHPAPRRLRPAPPTSPELTGPDAQRETIAPPIQPASDGPPPFPDAGEPLSAPPPFPNDGPLQTSDRWTADELPVIR